MFLGFCKSSSCVLDVLHQLPALNWAGERFTVIYGVNNLCQRKNSPKMQCVFRLLPWWFPACHRPPGPRKIGVKNNLHCDETDCDVDFGALGFTLTLKTIVIKMDKLNRWRLQTVERDAGWGQHCRFKVMLITGWSCFSWLTFPVVCRFGHAREVALGPGQPKPAGG